MATFTHKLDLINLWLCATHILFFRYEAGDHAGVFPTNDSTLVEKVGKLLEADLNVVFKLINTDGNF